MNMFCEAIVHTIMQPDQITHAAMRLGLALVIVGDNTYPKPLKISRSFLNFQVQQRNSLDYSDKLRQSCRPHKLHRARIPTQMQVRYYGVRSATNCAMIRLMNEQTTEAVNGC